MWPPIVSRLAEIVAPTRVWLVGGCVRDALRHSPIHDLDLVTLGSGLEVARHIANTLGAAYYPLDVKRRTGRVVIANHDDQLIIDVASLRGDNLLQDLRARDFTINAMAVSLTELDKVIDPLGGHGDYLAHKTLRQCSATSISDDPIRSIRAARFALKLGMRLESAILDAARQAANALVDESGDLVQPERARDELFKLIQIGNPASAFRLLAQLGLLQAILPVSAVGESWIARRLNTVSALSRLLGIISPKRGDNSAANLTLGIAVMALDRYRNDLQGHELVIGPNGRARASLLCLHAVAYGGLDWSRWGESIRLSRLEIDTLEQLDRARQWQWAEGQLVSRRMIYRYFRDAPTAGVDGMLLWLSEYLADHWPTPDPKAWGQAVNNVAAPIIDAYFQHREELVRPTPLVTGDDLMTALTLDAGPAIGVLLDKILEEQAAGAVASREQALALARQLVEAM